MQAFNKILIFSMVFILVLFIEIPPGTGCLIDSAYCDSDCYSSPYKHIFLSGLPQYSCICLADPRGCWDSPDCDRGWWQATGNGCQNIDETRGSNPSEGSTCKLVWDTMGGFCQCCGSREGKWDADRKGCIIDCSEGPPFTIDYCYDDQETITSCQQACGASPYCDEKNPSSSNHCNIEGDGGDVYWCNSNCQDTLKQDCGNNGCVGTCGTGANSCTYHKKGCSSDSCYDNSYNVDTQSSYCSSCGLQWGIGGEVAGTTCCGDDSGEKVRTCAKGDAVTEDACPTGLDNKACCSLSSKCVYNGNCYAQGDIHPSFSDLKCRAGKWDYPCNPYNCPSKTQPQTSCTGNCAGQSCNGCTTPATCLNDVALAPKCTYNFQSSCKYQFGDYLCVCGSGTLTADCYDRDSSQSYCEATATGCQDFTAKWNIGGEIAATTCCGDDCMNEFVRTCEKSGVTVDICSTGNDNLACCASNDKCVYKGVCYSDGSANPDYSCIHCNAGIWKNKEAGTDCAGSGEYCKACDGSGNCNQVPVDDPDCGIIDCDGVNYYYQFGTEGPTSTETCYYRDYADITSNRCEGFGNCKDANSPDCTDYSDSSQYSCETCKYISASSCTGNTKGSCSNYGISSQCDSTYACSSGSGDNNYGIGGDYKCQGYCDGAGSCDYAENCENCNVGDDCWPYGNGCEMRDYYCFAGSCDYSYDRYTDTACSYTGCSADLCDKTGTWQDYYCDAGSCSPHATGCSEPCNANNYCSGGSCSSGSCGTSGCPPNYCDGSTFYVYPASCDRYCDGSGNCQSCSCSKTPIGCSQAGNWDGDGIACNCDCDGYDVEESAANGNCNDGKDNDCDGYIDCAENGCIGQTGPNGDECCSANSDCTNYGYAVGCGYCDTDKECNYYGTSQLCNAAWKCSGSPGGDGYYDAPNYKIPSRGYCDGAGTCDYSLSAPVCDLGEGTPQERSGYDICKDGQSSCVDSCSDTLDNDGDGCTDGVDSNCGGKETIWDDGIDNDCDGLTDTSDDDCWNCNPGVEKRNCPKQDGVCAGSQETCNAQGKWDGCDDATYLAHNSNYENPEVSCDNLDNDCDGTTDGVTNPCGSGNCAGTRTCTAGGWGDCTTRNSDCGICCICENDNDPIETYDSNQDGDCGLCEECSGLKTCSYVPYGSDPKNDCSGNCDVCSGTGSCAGDQTLCTGDCVVCSGSGTVYNCGPDETVCEMLKCADCTGSGTSYSCNYNELEDEDCDPYDKLPIGQCDWDPDGLDYTWDYHVAINSECYALDTCTYESGYSNYDHWCADDDTGDTFPQGGCQATCDEHSDCSFITGCLEYCDTNPNCYGSNCACKTDLNAGDDCTCKRCNFCIEGPDGGDDDCYLEWRPDNPGMAQSNEEWYWFNCYKVRGRPSRAFIYIEPSLGNYELCYIGEFQNYDSCPQSTGDICVPEENAIVIQNDDPIEKYWILVRTDDVELANYNINLQCVLTGAAACIETDGGYVPKIKGTAYGNEDDNYYENTDECINNRYLNEIYCDGTNCISEIYDCLILGDNYRCSNGKCVYSERSGGGGGGDTPTFEMIDIINALRQILKKILGINL